MSRKAFQWTCFVLTLSIALGTMPVSAQSSVVPQRKRAKVISFQAVAINEADSVRPLYVGVMGEVARPGTYHVDPSELNVESIVVKRAGGFTSNASKTIRVIRHGKINHHQIYSENNNSQLEPGDLLVIESTRTFASTSKLQEFDQEQTTIHASYEEQAPDLGMQVAMLNVLDYPIVLRIRPEEATAANIAENILGQTPDILTYTSVISSDATTRLLPEETKRNINLVGGSVVVFDRGAVNRSRLPTNLPRPIESAIAMGAQSSLIGSPSGQSQELQYLGQQVMISNSNSHDFNSFSSQRNSNGNGLSSPSDFGPTTNDGRPDSYDSSASSKPRIANIPFTGSPQITKSSTGRIRSEPTQSDPIPQPDDATTQTPSATMDSFESLDEQPTPPSRGLSVLQTLALLFVAGASVGGAFIVRRALEAKIEYRSPTPQRIAETKFLEEPVAETVTVAAQKTLLERLIKNELPMTFETIEFPSDLALQGRIISKPILRVDGPQDVVQSQGPHFATKEVEPVGYSLQEAFAELDKPETNSVRRPHFMDVDRQQVDSATATPQVQREAVAASTSERTSAPLANALFELEQGGRS